MTRSSRGLALGAASLIALAFISLNACAARTEPMNQAELIDLATRYAAAWSGQNPEELASFYTANGSLRVNDGDPAVGRAAIAPKARRFMDAFPDMVVTMDSVRRENGRVIFSWIWTGTNTGPGGTGSSVRITGHEAWVLSADGLIVESEGHYDVAEYQRQLASGAGAS